MAAFHSQSDQFLTWTRRVNFSAAHFLSLPELSDAENVQRFGPSANSWAHGHNYSVDVTFKVSAACDDRTLLLEQQETVALLQACIVDPLDFKNLNRQIPFFETHLTTLENLARWIWQSLKDGLSQNQRFSRLSLSSLCVIESDDLYVTYYGGSGFDRPNSQPSPTSQAVPHYKEPDWLYLTRVVTFSAAHHLEHSDWSTEKNQRIFGRCYNPNGHGHQYELAITVGSVPDERLGMVVDLFLFDQMLQRVILDPLDHKNLNKDVPFLSGILPTSENLVKAFWQELVKEIAEPAQLVTLRLTQSGSHTVEYKGRLNA